MRRTAGWLLAPALAMALAALAYAVAALGALRNDDTRIVSAEAAVWDETIPLSGIVIRSERLLPVAAGEVILLGAGGERVPAGTVLGVYCSPAEGYFRGRLLLRLRAELEAAQTSLRHGFGRNTARQAARLRVALSAGDQSGAALAGVRLQYGLFGVPGGAVDRLGMEIESLLEHGAEQSVLAAPESGFFLRDTDGWEGLSPVGSDTLTADGVAAVLRRGPSPTEAAGRLITGSSWCYAALTDAASADRFVPGESVALVLGFQRLSAEVRRISIGADSCLVVFSCRTGLESVLSLRAADAAAYLGSVSGLALPAEALREDEAGLFVFRAAGPVVRREAVTVLARRDDKVLVASDALRDGSSILLGGDWADGMLMNR